MKTRNGFVSNSSSSSFVVLLPDNFDVDQFIEDNWESVDLSDYDYDENENEEESAKAIVEKAVKRFIEEHEVCEYDNSGDFYLIDNLFREYTIADIDAGGGDGTGILLDNEKVKKILGC